MILDVRRAEISDIESICRLSSQWENEQITYGLVANTREDIMRVISGFCWVAVSEGEIAGYLFGEVKPNEGNAVFSPSHECFFEVEEIYIEPACRDKGLGTLLIEHVSNELAREGITRFLVSSASKDWRSIADFYEKNGFRMWTLTMFK